MNNKCQKIKDTTRQWEEEIREEKENIEEMEKVMRSLLDVNDRMKKKIKWERNADVREKGKRKILPSALIYASLFEDSIGCILYVQ